MYSSNFKDADVQCPFYRGVGTRAIYCEGLQDKTMNTITFRKLADFDAYMQKYCNDKYRLCGVCKLAGEKYY